MENNKEYTIYCSRCGSEMKNTSRCCMKCGNINPEHPSNKNVVKYFEDNPKEELSLNKNTYIMSNDYVSVSNLKSLSLNLKVCFFFNLILFLLTMIIFIGLYYSEYGSFSGVISSNIWIVLIFVPLFYIYSYAYQLLFVKLGYSWWKSFIPIYNFMLISKRLFDNELLGLLTLVPVVGQIFIIVIMYRLATKFGRNGILMILFPYIMIPIISYSEDSYENYNISFDQNREFVFKVKKSFLVLCSLFVIAGVLIFIFKFPIVDYFKGKWKEVNEVIYGEE